MGRRLYKKTRRNKLARGPIKLGPSVVFEDGLSSLSNNCKNLENLTIQKSVRALTWLTKLKQYKFTKDSKIPCLSGHFYKLSTPMFLKVKSKQKYSYERTFSQNHSYDLSFSREPRDSSTSFYRKEFEFETNFYRKDRYFNILKLNI